MKKIESIHNKTKIIQNDELPYNTNNIMLNHDDLINFFNTNGLNDVKFNNINLVEGYLSNFSVQLARF